jgi:uncharacterized membrane protein (UPF0127 family)
MIKRLFIAIVLLISTTFSTIAPADGCKGNTTLDINGSQITVEVANTERARRYGLMFRNSLGADCGMLFIFPDTAVRTFTMRNTLIPLDIAFIAADGTIKEILTMQPGTQKYPSSVESDYALEANAGWFAEKALEVGMVVSLQNNGESSDLGSIR